VVGIRPPRYVLDRYNKYRAALERRGKFSRRGRAKGNECRRWHGTPHDYCKLLGDALSDKGRCDDTSCAICSIVSTGFRKPAFNLFSFQRFGYGIYFSATSSKSDDYTGRNGSNLPTAKSGRKAILLCKVAAGRGAKVPIPMPLATAAPMGFDSVIGDPRCYLGLNFDELVVYNSAAVVPAYVIVYE